MGTIRIVSTEPRAFEDRAEAGRALARELSDLKGQHPVVLGIPRGAVPMAAVIADELDGELDVVIVRKLGAPYNPELAIGSVTEEGEAIVDDRIAHAVGASGDYIEQEKRRQMERIEERKRVYREVRPKAALEGRIVVIVNDGLATGATMKAALTSARAEKHESLIAAEPVGAQSTVQEMARYSY